jgi:hypothetical protein
VQRLETATYDDSVFVNCPFDEQYQPLFYALVFCIYDAGFFPRCALELDDASTNRLESIMRIIDQCRYGLHDISRTEVSAYGLPRFNMPLELGIFLGARRYGDRAHRTKSCLVLDRRPYRYQRFISDISGQDIRAHADRPRGAVIRTRDWLRTASRRRAILGGDEIHKRYLRFRRELPAMCRELRLRQTELIFADYQNLVEQWLLVNEL